MKKLAAVSLLALALALPAAADDGAAAKGTVVSVSASKISVQDAKGVVLSCKVGAHSPSVTGYAAGDSVALACAGPKGKLVLVKLRHLGNAGAKSDTKPVTFAGAVTSISESSVSLHDGDRDLTCTRDATSPALTGVTVGQHVRVTCANGVLTAWAPISSTHVTRGASGTLTALGADSLTVHGDDGDLTCKLGASSPSTSSFKIGDRVKIGCLDGVLAAIAKADGGSGGGGHTVHAAVGTLTVLTPASVTVHSDGGDVTCTLGASSPPTTGLAVGDRVKMGCLDGVVVGLAKVDAPPPPPPGDAHTQTAAGTITALSDGSLTIHGEHGDLTCTRGASSPGLGDYHVGDRVGIACTDGVLVKIVRLS